MRKTRKKSKGKGRDIHAIMRANKGADTRPELLLRRTLREHGLIGYRVHPKKVLGKPDVLYTRWRVAIFIHGCFWHGCELCGKTRPRKNAQFWEEKMRLNRSRDEVVRAGLEEKGYVVLTFWEHDLRDMREVTGRVREALRTRGRLVPDQRITTPSS